MTSGCVQVAQRDLHFPCYQLTTVSRSKYQSITKTQPIQIVSALVIDSFLMHNYLAIDSDGIKAAQVPLITLLYVVGLSQSITLSRQFHHPSYTVAVLSSTPPPGW